MTDRLDRLREGLDEPLLVTNGVNVRYLVGFASSNAALLVEPERVRLFTDFRYAEAARAVAGVEFAETRRSLLADLAELLEGRIAFEADDLRYSGYETLAAGGGLELVPRRGAVEELRAVKHPGELDAMRRAARITDEAYERLVAEPFVGRTERELAWRMEELFHELGAERAAFSVVVATGANGARPHAEPSERPVEAGEAVVVDAGCVVDGYCSDCTRTFATGAIPSELARTTSVSKRRRRRSRPCGPARTHALSTPSRATASRQRASERHSATGSGTESGCSYTRRLGSHRCRPRTRHSP